MEGLAFVYAFAHAQEILLKVRDCRALCYKCRKTTETTEGVSSHPGETGVVCPKRQRNAPLAREKSRACEKQLPTSSVYVRPY
jgi:hypothetical protein